MWNPFSRKKKKPKGVSPKLLDRYQIRDDFTPESPEKFRSLAFREPVTNYNEFVSQLLALVNVYATEHCVIRFECNSKGDIGACLSCVCEHILVPDMIAFAGGEVAVWPAKR